MFWEGRTNDEGVSQYDSFHGLVLQGRIEVKGGIGVVGWRDGETNEEELTETDENRTNVKKAYLLLSNGEKLHPGAVVLCTGYKSSWDAVFEGATAHSITLFIRSKPSTRTYSERDRDDTGSP